ncbi:MAG TPA: hypothetical protein VMR34_01190 [Candidatus Saccharimonadales bacterium]|nr:hypothetical protein [Candidatus Saccharimonadales bacterium]
MRTRRRLIALVCFLIVSLFTFGKHNSALADSGTNLTTSPITLGLNIKPGSGETQTLQVKNNASTPVQINMQIKTFGAYGASGQAAITNFPSSDPAASYIKLSPTTFMAQPGVWNYVKATIALPKVASLGYYYAVVFKPIVTNPVTLPNHNVVTGSNAILMLVDTGSTNEIKQVQVANFSATKHLYEYLPASFNVVIHNPGNIFLAPSGDIFISRNSNGTNTIDSLPINSGGGNVLPDSNRGFSANWQNGSPLFVPLVVNGQPAYNKKGQPVLQLKWNFSQINKLRIGKYFAKLALAYNNGNHEVLLNSTISFWVIPWKILLVLLLIALLVLFSVYSLVRSIIRRTKAFRNKKRKSSH